jgi:tetraacyldisaccharide-1-P 4'-kinase
VRLPIVVVGSLRAGGGGKTPVVEWLAREFPDAALLVHPTPDEQVLLDAEFPGRVFAHRSFLQAWKEAHRKGFGWAISDGGYQDPQLDLCRKILVWNEPLPRSTADLHPCGPWRELAEAAERADLHLVRNGVDLPLGLDAMRYRWESSLSGADSGQILLACAVGKPQSVRDDLKALGHEIVAEHCPNDHCGFSSGRLRQLEEHHPGLPWVVTAKDLPRWPSSQRRHLVLFRRWIPENPGALMEWVKQGRNPSESVFH